jgi:hypothetical protein
MTPPLHSSRWLKATNGGLPSDQIVRRKTQWLRAVAMDMLRKMMRKSPAEETGLERASRWLQDASNGKRSLDVYTYAHKRTQTHTHTDLYICVCVAYYLDIFAMIWHSYYCTCMIKSLYWREHRQETPLLPARNIQTYGSLLIVLSNHLKPVRGLNEYSLICLGIRAR